MAGKKQTEKKNDLVARPAGAQSLTLLLEKRLRAVQSRLGIEGEELDRGHAGQPQ